jgi:hypothetical protein
MSRLLIVVGLAAGLAWPHQGHAAGVFDGYYEAAGTSGKGCGAASLNLTIESDTVVKGFYQGGRGNTPEARGLVQQDGKAAIAFGPASSPFHGRFAFKEDGTLTAQVTTPFCGEALLHGKRLSR